jgi:hypothetical protein
MGKGFLYSYNWQLVGHGVFLLQAIFTKQLVGWQVPIVTI